MPPTKAVVEGVAEAWAGWLYTQNVTAVDAVEDGVERALRAWLDANRDAIIAAVAEAIAKRWKPDDPTEEI